MAGKPTATCHSIDWPLIKIYFKTIYLLSRPHRRISCTRDGRGRRRIRLRQTEPTNGTRISQQNAANSVEAVLLGCETKSSRTIHQGGWGECFVLLPRSEPVCLFPMFNAPQSIPKSVANPKNWIEANYKKWPWEFIDLTVSSYNGKNGEGERKKFSLFDPIFFFIVHVTCYLGSQKKILNYNWKQWIFYSMFRNGVRWIPKKLWIR